MTDHFRPALKNSLPAADFALDLPPAYVLALPGMGFNQKSAGKIVLGLWQIQQISAVE
jgi:hypothetical protein